MTRSWTDDLKRGLFERRLFRRLRSTLLGAAGWVFLGGLGPLQAATQIVISVPDQKLALIADGKKLASYKISTSRFGVSDKPSSYGTPLGKLAIADRFGAGLPPGAVLKGRRPTGEVLPVNAKGRDPIVTRILHLNGLEAGNRNAYSRGIYIHGTPVERGLGKPESWGCIRMRSADVIELFDRVQLGTRVEILDQRLSKVLPAALLASQAVPAKVPVASAAPSVQALKLPLSPTQRSAKATVAARDVPSKATPVKGRVVSRKPVPAGDKPQKSSAPVESPRLHASRPQGMESGSSKIGWTLPLW
jgi:hypothetical protein